MDRNTKIIIAAVVLAALSFGVYSQYKKDTVMGTSAAKPDLPEVKGSDDVDRFSITNGEKGVVMLEKKGDKWMLTKPVSALTNQANVKSLLDGIKELKISDTAVNNPTDDIKKSYEIDGAKGVHFETWKGAEKKLDLTFGKSGGGGDSVLIAGKTDIYLAKGYQGWMYTREAKEWRDKEIFKFDDATATGVTVMNKNGTFVFAKGDKGWTGTVKDKPIAHLDEDKIKALLGTFKGLNADDFGDGKLPAETGMDAPEATITITLKDAMYVLKIGKTSTGQARFAMKDPEPTIYVVGPAVGDWATADAAKFQQPLDGGAKDAAPPGMPPGMMGMPPGMGGMPPGMGGMPPGMPPGHP